MLFGLGSVPCSVLAVHYKVHVLVYGKVFQEMNFFFSCYLYYNVNNILIDSYFISELCSFK